MSTPFTWPDGQRAALSLTFDDARLSQADRGFSVLDEQNARATFYVSFGTLEQRLDTWRVAIANGHEIGNHTTTHPCSGNFAFSRGNALEEYSLARMEKELTDANAKIEELLGVTPRTFAYPCGQTFVGRGENFQSYVPLVAKYFRAGRGFNAESMNVPEFCDPSHLFGVDADNKSADELLVWAENALNEGAWLIFAAHDVGTKGRQTLCEDALKTLCQFARKNGIWLDTVSNIVEHVRKVRCI
jgi:peptidoglycan/xylan/chitin deacetylase (PgdA/CDA1 family)